MSIWAVIPARPLEEGKSRLAAALNLAERKRLNDRFFRHTLETAAIVVGQARTLAVSRSDTLLEIARSMGFPTLLEEPPHGLNEALTQGARAARARGATTVLSISCDLPFLTAEELRQLLAVAADHDGLAIASDRAGAGTNALVQPIEVLPYRYGAGSFAAHRQAALAAGRRLPELRLAGLMYDIDTPDDLEQMEDILRERWPPMRGMSVPGCVSQRI